MKPTLRAASGLVPTILVVGSSNTDMIVRVPRLPGPGETILGRGFAQAAGGKGANQAVAAARASTRARITFIGRVGTDALGEAARRNLRQDAINVRYLTSDPHAASGVALIGVDDHGENSIAVAPGANARVSPADVRAARAQFSRARLLVTQLEIPLPTVRAALTLAARHRIPTLLNPAPAQPLPDDLLRQVTLLTPNETEAGRLTGVDTSNDEGVCQAARQLLARGVRTVIVTLGARGVCLAQPDRIRFLPGFRVRVVDTTAAGDVFNGALAAALAEGEDLLKAIRFANAAAALSVTRLGAQPSAPNRAAIRRFLASAPEASLRPARRRRR